MSDHSILEYARYHGLCIEDQSRDVFEYLQNLTPPSDTDLEEDARIQESDILKAAITLEEPKIQLSREAGVFLHKSIQKPDHQINWSDFLPEPRKNDRFKLEVPILSTDQDQDVAEMKREMKSRPE